MQGERKSRVRAVWIGAAVALVLLPSTAFAYVDPGTTNVVFSLFSFLAPLFGAIAVAFSFVFRPVRRAVTWPFRVLFRRRRDRPGSAPRPEGDPDGEAG
ncbi:MAG: hypothetical protein JXP34_29210 [Planctomycetes bacterium]|nr:hypothetical protein [Planctomycetota bacterium]